MGVGEGCSGSEILSVLSPSIMHAAFPPLAYGIKVSSGSLPGKEIASKQASVAGSRRDRHRVVIFLLHLRPAHFPPRQSPLGSFTGRVLKLSAE